MQNAVTLITVGKGEILDLLNCNARPAPNGFTLIVQVATLGK